MSFAEELSGGDGSGGGGAAAFASAVWIVSHKGQIRVLSHLFQEQTLLFALAWRTHNCQCTNTLEKAKIPLDISPKGDVCTTMTKILETLVELSSGPVTFLQLSFSQVWARKFLSTNLVASC